VWQENRFMKRPYLGLNDASRAFSAAIKNRLPYNHIYNVVSENAVLDDILNTIMKYKPITINQVNTPLLNQYSYIVSNDKIKDYIILTDKVRDGIRDTFRWFK
jgi:nucleoside-diphosphate-sugar epimerase